MRLFNVYNRKLVQFYANVPSYVVASHRWAVATETSYQDVEKQRNTRKDGYKKLEGFVEYVKAHIPHVEWLWIDTCCINQRNDAELSDAVNSMFKWYHNADVCLAYLTDVSDRGNEDEFTCSEWFFRGWTLQELIAPQTVIFLTQDWQVIGHKGCSGSNRSRTPLYVGRPLESIIASITQIPQAVLHDSRRLEDFSSEERLKWVNGRNTTREEDMSYCLFGILDVAIGANYGEGAERARRRLLAEIGKGNADETQPSPSSTIPFRRDSDYVEREELTSQVHAKLSVPAAKVALVALGGVGYRTHSPQHYCYADTILGSYSLRSNTPTAFENSHRLRRCYGYMRAMRRDTNKACERWQSRSKYADDKRRKQRYSSWYGRGYGTRGRECG